mmetsp:Transcript_10852/g.19467  ORF Transcript_10852/g.19467 Transcript_10852/m.19467 type:complete len:370 (-) Transcript_10852:1143-2252(-)
MPTNVECARFHVLATRRRQRRKNRRRHQASRPPRMPSWAAEVAILRRRRLASHFHHLLRVSAPSSLLEASCSASALVQPVRRPSSSAPAPAPPPSEAALPAAAQASSAAYRLSRRPTCLWWCHRRPRRPSSDPEASLSEVPLQVPRSSAMRLPQQEGSSLLSRRLRHHLRHRRRLPQKCSQWERGCLAHRPLLQRHRRQRVGLRSSEPEPHPPGLPSSEPRPRPPGPRFSEHRPHPRSHCSSGYHQHLQVLQLLNRSRSSGPRLPRPPAPRSSEAPRPLSRHPPARRSSSEALRSSEAPPLPPGRQSSGVHRHHPERRCLERLQPPRGRRSSGEGAASLTLLLRLPLGRCSPLQHQRQPRPRTQRSLSF